MSNVQSIISGDELAGLEAFIDGRTVPLGPEDAPRAGRQHEGMKLTDLAQQLAAQTPDVSEHDFDAPFPLSKAPAVRSVTTAQVSGSQVSAYRNLNNGMWSLKSKASGLVAGHTDHVVIHDAKFAVGEGGRQRVIQAQQKNVHAFVRGRVAHVEPHEPPAGAVPVSYNPFTGLWPLTGGAACRSPCQT